jgi:hypothetical protein
MTRTPSSSCSNALHVHRREELDRARAQHALEQRLVHVGAMAHGVGVAEARAERLAHRHVRDLGFVQRVIA